MNVKQLIEKLKTMNPDAKVMVQGYDHSYREASIHTSRAEVYKEKYKTHYTEPYDLNAPENIDIVVLN